MRSAALAPAPSLKKALLKLQRLPGANFRPAFAAGVSANRVCLERELLDHNRLMFEKKPSPSG
jgi:cyclopropane-fatty-acyl-phospholipid synthase